MIMIIIMMVVVVVVVVVMVMVMVMVEIVIVSSERNSFFSLTILYMDPYGLHKPLYKIRIKMKTKNNGIINACNVTFPIKFTELIIYSSVKIVQLNICLPNIYSKNGCLFTFNNSS